MENMLKKFGDVLKTIYGYSIVICLFAGGMTFLGYLAALLLGGEIAQEICTFIYNTIVPDTLKIEHEYIFRSLACLNPA